MALITIGSSGIIGATGTITIRESTFPNQWAAQKIEYANIRGFDVGRDAKMLPRVTVQEALDLIDYWDEQGGDSTHADVAIWRMFATHAITLTAGVPRNETFPQLQFFWDGLQKRAIALASTDAIPTQWDMISEAVTEAIDELPRRVRDAARFLWPDWLTTAIKFGAVGLGGALAIYWIVKSGKKG